MKIEFEKQFGKGTDPWYAKAERWVKKQFKNPFIQHLALGFVAWLKEIWIEGKIKMEMNSVDEQIKEIHKEWDEKTKPKVRSIETESEVEGLKDMSIQAYQEAAKADAWLFGDYDAYKVYEDTEDS